jgi:hypothetical protein
MSFLSVGLSVIALLAVLHMLAQVLVDFYNLVRKP